MVATGVIGAAHWQDVECGAYAADLGRLRELAVAAGGPVAELGAGTGRVALALAETGAELIAIERDPELAAELRDRAAAAGAERIHVLVAEAVAAPIESGSLALALAPMQFLHLLPAPDRAKLLERVAAWLRPGGRLAAVVLAEPSAASPEDAEPPVPDVRELENGWVLSSLPLSVRAEPGRIEVDRLRQTVSPSGELAEGRSTDVLWDLDAGALVSDASRFGLFELSRESLPGDELHVDSVLVVMERR